MRKRYSTKLGALTLLLIACALLSLSMSVDSREPLTKLVVQIHLEMYDDQASINEACETKTNVNGCTYQMGKGRWRVITHKPKDFCDWSNMRTLGHEVLHTAGFSHAPTYAVGNVTGDPIPWSATDCRMFR